MKWLLLLLVILPICAWGQIITTIAGTGIVGSSGDNAPAVNATLAYPHGIVIDKNGNVFIADYYNWKIRKITTNGIITAIVGTGVAGYNGDNISAITAQINNVVSVAVDDTGNLYFADGSNYRVRKINTNGIITTVAGTGVGGYNGDSILATTAKLYGPSGVWVDKHGNLFIADYSNHRVRKVNSLGIITTIAGTGIAGYNGDEIPAKTAQLNQPYTITVDDTGNLYIADIFNYRIRKIDTFGIIHTIAGTGTFGYNGDNIQATLAQICSSFIALDHLGNIYISDDCNSQRIRKIDTFGIITTVVGTGTAGYNGDSIPSISAQLNYPGGIFSDLCNNIYISDGYNQRIRKVWFNTDTVPQVNVAITPNDTVITGTTVTTTAIVNTGTVTGYQWIKNGANASTNSAYTYTPVNGDSVYCIVTVRACTGRMYIDTTTAIHITVTGDAGIANTNSHTTYNTYPNPVHDVLHVATTEAQHYVLHNLMGVTLLQGSVDKQNTLDMRTMPTGVYLLQMTDNNGARVVQRIVKE